jgi:hypothetical protein
MEKSLENHGSEMIGETFSWRNPPENLSENH